MARVTSAYAYPVVLEPLDGEVIARVPLLPEVLTGGATEAEALEAVQDALDEAVLGRLTRGEEIPVAPFGAALNAPMVFLPPITAGRVLVDAERRARDMSKRDLAKGMNKDEKVARRILDGRGAVTMDVVTDALNSMGQQATLVETGAVRAMIEHLAWCRVQRAQNLDSIARLERGDFRLMEQTPAGRFDISDAHIARLRQSVAELDALIERYG